MAINGGFVTSDAHGIIYSAWVKDQFTANIRKCITIQQFISVWEAVSQVVGQGKGFLAEVLHQ